jgi:hypothetical protein
LCATIFSATEKSNRPNSHISVIWISILRDRRTIRRYPCKNCLLVVARYVLSKQTRLQSCPLRPAHEDLQHASAIRCSRPAALSH